MNQNKKLLIVEDDEDFAFILKKKFTDEGFNVIMAQDGEMGAAQAEMEKPDIILSDVLLPKMNGTDMAKKIKAANKDIPIVFLTNLKDVEQVMEDIKIMDCECLIKSDNHISEIVEKIKSKIK